MARFRAIASSLAAALIMAGAQAPAFAQCRLCSEPTTELREDRGSGDIRLQVEASLDFDRIVLLGGGSGAATLLPGGERSASGSVASLSASAMVGTVTVHGESGRAVRVELPPRIELYSLSGGRIVIDSIATDLAGAPRLDPDGNLTFRFGGTLNVSGDSEGEYRGDVPITVEYL